MTPSRWLAALARVESRFAQIDDSSSPSRDRVALMILVAGMLGVTALVWAMRFPPVWESLHDTIALLDAGWRIHHGQVPHRDFYSVIGPFPLAVLGAAAKWPGGPAAGLPKLLLVCGLIFSAAAWGMSRERLDVWWRLLFAGLLLLLPLTPSFLGAGEGPPFGSLHHTTYGMIYNRLGWTAFSLQLLIMLVPRGNADSPRRALQESFAIGLLVGLGIFTKINFLIGSLGVLAYWLLTHGSHRGTRVTGLLAGVGATVIALTIYPGGTVEYFGDQIRLLQVSRAGESYLGSLWGVYGE